jgi:peptidoglycan/xylan/chitin deacetylase (PgdA/CDA1 family)
MLSILTYHSLDTSGSVVSVAPEDFARQMACIAESGYRGIALREAVAHREAMGDWPDQSVVLTFDDGFRNFYDEGMPVLERHGFTATVFIVSDYMGRRNDWEIPPAGLGSRAILKWSEAVELSANGIEIGSHTKTHPDLRRLSEAEAQQEIVGSRIEIEQRLGQRVESFAYPFGEANPFAREYVEKEFQAACTTVLQRANGEPLHNLPRVDMYYLRKDHRLEQLLNGKLDRYLTVRSLGRTVRRAIMH